jgi:hypothetical protein
VIEMKVGDWVYYNGYDEWLEGTLGYLDRVIDTYCVVEFIKDNKGNRLKYRKQCSIKELIPAKIQPMTKEEFKFLMDLALATKDFEWCKQLMEQFEGRKKEKVC